MKPKKTSTKKKVAGTALRGTSSRAKTGKNVPVSAKAAAKTPIGKIAAAKTPATAKKKISTRLKRVTKRVGETIQKTGARIAKTAAESIVKAASGKNLPDRIQSAAAKPVQKIIKRTEPEKIASKKRIRPHRASEASASAVPEPATPVASQEKNPASPKPATDVAGSKLSFAPATPVERPSPAPVSKPKPPSRPVPARIPPILLEGDQPDIAQSSGPGQRYVLTPRFSENPITAESELPSAYGTQQLLLTARDPHWLYAHWDFTDDQLRHYNALSLDHHLVLRIHAHALSERAEQEVHLAADSRHWFAHVDRAGTRYFAQLGFYAKSGRWTAVATSGATLTPPDSMAEDTSVEFATIPFEVPMEKLLTLVKEAVLENVPLAQALHEIRSEERPDLPAFPTAAAGGQPAEPVNGESGHGVAIREWTPEQDRALTEIISMDHVRRVWMGSMEITELIRRQVIQELAASAAAQRGQPEGAPTSPGALPEEVSGAISSPARKVAGGERGFWFNINAELIIYGATEPDATVTIAGRKIRLRPDGSFSYRFALPDGNYELPAVAVSADQTDGRAAELSFRRATEYRGDVGTHPQDPALKRPAAEAF